MKDKSIFQGMKHLKEYLFSFNEEDSYYKVWLENEDSYLFQGTISIKKNESNISLYKRYIFSQYQQIGD